MDIPREKKPSHKRLWMIGGGVLLLLAILGVAQLKPAAPQIERSTLWLDRVKRGTMIREVRGNGTLVPENQRIVSAMTAGRVELVLVRPGGKVDAGTVLLTLSNPDVQLEALSAERQLKLAEADLASLRSAFETQRLVATTALAAARSENNEALRGVRSAEKLAAEGLASAFEVERARDRAVETRTRFEGEQARLKVVEQDTRTQLELRRAEVERLRAIAQFQRDRVTSMQVRAGAAGVVQELALEPGQWVNPGQRLARVAGQERLKAVVRVPETQARDIALGLPAEIDTRNGIVRGIVSRIDPAVQAGTVAVDLAIEGALPKGARPDLSVDATIQIDRIENALYVGRPAEASSEATVGLFRLEPNSAYARRVQVKLGRGSANTIEILAGLNEGDEVILSEMSRWDHTERVRLK